MQFYTDNAVDHDYKTQARHFDKTDTKQQAASPVSKQCTVS